MKAKEWYREFEACTTNEEFEAKLEECLKSLVKEANFLIAKRGCKTRDAMKACINEVNNKWYAIRRILQKNQKDPEWHHNILYRAELFEDGFKAAYVHMHPKNKWMFDLDSHKRMIEKRQQEIDEMEKTPLIPYTVTPFEKLTMENLPMEIIELLHAIGNYTSHGIPILMVQPLAYRVALLRYWNHKGEINLQDVEEFEKDKQAWVIAHRDVI